MPRLFLLAGAVVLFATAFVHANDWSQWLGPNRDGMPEYRRLTDGMRCIALPSAEVVPSASGTSPARVPLRIA